MALKGRCSVEFRGGFHHILSQLWVGDLMPEKARKSESQRLESANLKLEKVTRPGLQVQVGEG